jgi:hypothetical protein
MSQFDDDEEEGYFEEIDPDAELTGFEAKFKQIEGMDTTPAQLMEMRVDDLVPLYIRCRNQLATDTKSYKARKERVKGFMGMISMALRDKADKVGTDTFKGSYGTAFRQTKEKFTINDWDSFSKWLLATGNLQVIQKRVSPNAVKEIRTLDGEMPPGVGVFKEVEFAVRAPSGSKRG